MTNANARYINKSKVCKALMSGFEEFVADHTEYTAADISPSKTTLWDLGFDKSSIDSLHLAYEDGPQYNIKCLDEFPIDLTETVKSFIERLYEYNY